MDVKDFYYDLPQELIAQDPLEKRDNSRLMVIHRDTGEIEHKHFHDITEYLNPGDCLVINDTKVIPARLLGEKEGTGAAIEVLLLKNKGDNVWECLVKPGKKMKPGARVLFGVETENKGTAEEGNDENSDGFKKAILTGEVLDVVEEGNRLIKFTYEGIWEEVLDSLGEMPLPPYITHKLEDKNRYQTVYAKNTGSAAAPTAGLHFTEELLKQIEDMGVKIARLTLHVGLGTFRPVKVEKIEDHHMHTEYYELSQEAADIINETRRKGGRVISVGTTSTRTMETVGTAQGLHKVASGESYDESNELKPASGWTSIFIYPGYEFKVVDSLITNFHLPESTLIMLVSAFYEREGVMKAYEEAVKERYRFFSFGDAMILL
ncbi:S-adenosylmethionine--tRNA ribosyltransferase-isomerase [Lachnospiraceae bacterium]|nr:S-adenosylmethionine--tRNA ribosyltransferase-isomerase [Lachnospiraceae bacterium]